MEQVRMERDSLGEVPVPKEALYGAQSVRSVENFHITGQKINPLMIWSLGAVKKACAQANEAVGELDAKIAQAITQASDEIMEGTHNEEFITDAIQGGAGTSMNMNVNEIIANRASQLLGDPLGTYTSVHPNDHVNKAQSTNDVIPTAGKLTTLLLGEALLAEMDLLETAFSKKAEAYKEVIKVGRTHLQDAVLISMGQVFASYSTLLTRDMKRLTHALEEMKTVNLGATAVGTGINSVVGYKEAAVQKLTDVTGISFVGAEDLVDSTKHIDGFAYVHSALKTFATGLSRLSNDLRLMASGPKVGLNELHLPAKQPGSSIMPGKVNPVIPEVVNQVCFQVIGNDATITMAVEAGQMELNVFEPVLFFNLFQSMEILKNACHTLRVNAIEGLTVNEAQCTQYVEESLAMATALLKELGYTKVTELTNQALKENRTLRELVLEQGLLSEEVLEETLDPHSMIHPR